MTSERIRVLIAEYHTGVRKGVIDILDSAKDIEVVGEVDNGVDAVRLVEERRPDILVLDVELPDRRGKEVARMLTQRADLKVSILAISSYRDSQIRAGMLAVGAAAYLIKDDLPGHILTTLREIHASSTPAKQDAAGNSACSGADNHHRM